MNKYKIKTNYTFEAPNEADGDRIYGLLDVNLLEKTIEQAAMELYDWVVESVGHPDHVILSKCYVMEGEDDPSLIIAVYHYDTQKITTPDGIEAVGWDEIARAALSVNL